MFKHKHPYPPFIPKHSSKLIVGTLPPPRFSTGMLKPDDVDFCYGSRDGSLWKILDKIFNLNLKYENTSFAIAQRKQFLKDRKIGICDIVESADRQKIDATDLGMQNVALRELLKYINEHLEVTSLIFTGGNSKNGPEYFFRKLLKEHQLQLEVLSDEVPRIHQLRIGERIITTVSLTAPSGSANRAIGSMPLYKQLKAKDPNFNTFDFRVLQYKEFF